MRRPRIGSDNDLRVMAQRLPVAGLRRLDPPSRHASRRRARGEARKPRCARHEPEPDHVPMKNLFDTTISRMRIALLISLPAMFGIARCHSPYDPRRTGDDAVAIYPERDAGRWTVDEHGLGPLRAGLSIPEAGQFLAGAISIPAGEETSSCSYADWPDAPAGVYVMIENGVISRVEVDSATIATAAGAKVGDTEAQIEAMYPGRVARQHHKFTDGRYLIVRASPAAADAGDHRLVFETDGRRVIRYRAGMYPAVLDDEGCTDPSDVS
jgi:hypothetical protein